MIHLGQNLCISKGTEFLTEHASVGAGGAAEPEESEYEKKAEDRYDDQDEREVERRRVVGVQLGHDLEREDLLGLEQEVHAPAHDGERAALKKKKKKTLTL